jgi:competence protein ComEC
MQNDENKYNWTYFLEDIKRIPFLRLLIPLVLGIVFRHSFVAADFNALTTAVLLTATIIIAHILKIYRRYSLRWLFGMHCFLTLFFIGVYLVQIQPDKTAAPVGVKNYFKLLVTENPRINENSMRLNVDILAFSDDGKLWNRCDENSTVYLENSHETVLTPGNVFICETTFNEVAPPQNPEEFNYKEYLNRRGIFVTAYIKAGNLAVVDSGRINPYRQFVLNIQKSAYKILQNAQLGDEELSVAIALLTGNKEYLDDELRQSYTAAGSIHLLAVSGLHVGIIFMVLNFLLQFLNRNRKLLIVKSLIILAFLWIYSSIAGMAPSIVRASTMFSIFIVAEMLNKPKNTYNNISFSCFLTCLFNPYAIFDTGFQLSYTAVLGIVYFQPKFMKFVYTRNKFLKAVAGCLTVTLAAQLGTLPIILYVFKTFPVYFLFSNLLLVPFTTLVMYIGLTVMALSWSAILLPLTGAVLNFCIYLMNITVKFFHNLPYSKVDGIFFNGFQCALLVAVILAFALRLSFNKRMFFRTALILLAAIFTVRAEHQYRISSHREFGIFGLKKNFYAYFIGNGRGFSLRDSASIEKTFDFNTKNYLITKGFSSESQLTSFSTVDSVPDSYNGIILFSGKRIALLPQLPVNVKFTGTPFAVNCLYITGNRRESPETVLSCYNPEEIIIAGDISPNMANEWRLVAESKQIPCRNIREEGFWNRNCK